MTYSLARDRRRRRREHVADQRLSKRQYEALDFIAHYIAERGIPPSARDFSVSSNAAIELLRSLERKGYIRTSPGRARAITVLRRYAVVRLPGMP